MCKSKQQQWAKDILKEIITLMKDKDYNGDFLTEGYKYTINAVIDNYSQTYYLVGKDKNISLFHRYKDYRNGLYSNILMSKKARKLLEKHKRLTEENDRIIKELIGIINPILEKIDDRKIARKLQKNSSVDTIRKRLKTINDHGITIKDYTNLKTQFEKLEENVKELEGMDLSEKLHGEHLTPQSHTRRILNEVYERLKKYPKSSINLEKEIEFAFTDCKICIITKEESKSLDGKGKKYEDKEIKSFIKNLKNRFDNPDFQQRFENDCYALTNCAKKSHGFGSIRIQVLMNAHVSFVDGQGNEKNLKDCLDYLKDGNYTIDGCVGDVEELDDDA